MLKAAMVYRQDGRDIVLAHTTDAGVLRALRDQVLKEAACELDSWRTADTDVAALAAAEFEALRRLLDFLLTGAKPTGTEGHDEVLDRIVGEELAARRAGRPPGEGV